MVISTNFFKTEYKDHGLTPTLNEDRVMLIENGSYLLHLVKNNLANVELVHSNVTPHYKDLVIDAAPQMIIIDLDALESKRLSIIKDLRSFYSGPLIVLTLKDDEEEQLQAFNLGIDDYVRKPISATIFTAKINALSRRNKERIMLDDMGALTIGALTIQPKSQQCIVNNSRVKLSGFEFNLLKLLMQNVGNILSRDMIYARLLGREYNGVERTVDVRMSQLREKLSLKALNNLHIETVWGQGYMLNLD
ncbi:response regulator transcription factor [Colwellia sp. RSH04]|uniref:response regulator transcription factor n=1 Tax=Colwellia sp. RSH04 TaxID=2305464 RepID=UPI000E58CDDC|nr:response regulator transcription factor [Colwellia sp. RSH04]RHW77546.1 DNA-binding response regulator [Colwellia sp. RSH04]